MLSKDDHALIETILRRKLVDRELLDNALIELEERLSAGETHSLVDWLIDKGVLSKAKLEFLLREGGSAKMERIKGYRIISKIGEGGMGTVYKALQLSMDREVALKILAPKLAKNTEYLERFNREARSAAILSHPNIVTGIDVGECDGLHYFVMEFIDGPTLRQVMREKKRLPEKEALDIILQIAKALQQAESKGIIHRDIKPDNIMLTNSGVAKLADLGLAKSAGDVSVTQTGEAFGTPLYMSPEQARGQRQIDIRCDIYSLGATFYHVVAGLPPFTGETPAVVMTKHINEALISPKQFVPELSDGVCAVIDKMMRKNPDERYLNVSDLIEDLTRLKKNQLPLCQAEKSSGTEKLTAIKTPAKKKKLVSALIVAITALFVITLFVAVAIRQRNKTRDTLAAHTPTPQASPIPASPGTISPAPSPTKVTPSTKPTLSPTAIQHADDTADKLLSEARSYIDNNPQDIQGALERLTKIIRQYPDSPGAKSAANMIAKLEQTNKVSQLRKDMAEVENFAAKNPDKLEALVAKWRALQEQAKGTDLEEIINTRLSKTKTVWQEQQRAKELDMLFDEARRTANELRDDPIKVYQHWEKLQTDFKDSRYEEKAAEEFQSAARARLNFISVKFEEAAISARKACDIRDFGTAIKAYQEFMASFPGTEYSDKASTNITEIKKTASTEKETIIQQANKQLQDRRFDDAVRSYEQLKTFHLNEFDIEADELVRKVGDAKNAYFSSLRSEAYIKIYANLKYLRFSEAEKECNSMIVNQRFAPVADNLKIETAAIKSSKLFWEQFVSHLGKQVGQSKTFQVRQGDTNTTITIKIGSINNNVVMPQNPDGRPTPLYDLAFNSLELLSREFFRITGKDVRDEDLYNFACIAFYLGYSKEAQERLTKIENGNMAAPVKLFLEKMPLVRSALEEDEAASLFNRAAKAFQAGQFSTALKLLNSLSTKYPNTKLVAEKNPAMREMLEKCQPPKR